MFKNILQKRNEDVFYYLTPKGNIGLNNFLNPLSIKEEEFNYLKDIIIRYNLKKGFELATAFGVSSIAIGLGMKETNGKLVTMDAYVEESCNNWEAYRNKDPIVNTEAIGYKSVNFLIKEFDLENIVFPEFGWSPIHTEKCIRNHFSEGEKLDFVFLDAGHFPEQIMKDILGFHPFLGDKFVLAFHDVYPHMFTEEVMNLIYSLYNKQLKIVVPHGPGCQLAVLIKD